MSRTKRASAADLKARDLMTPDVLCISDDSTLDELSAFLIRHEISGAVVLDAEREPVGVVSMSDLAAHVEKRSEFTAVGRSDYFVRGWQDKFDPTDMLEFHIEDTELRVKDILNPQLYSVDADASLEEVAEMMAGHLHRVLVTEGRELAGILTTSDFLKLFVREEEDRPRASLGESVNEGASASA